MFSSFVHVKPYLKINCDFSVQKKKLAYRTRVVISGGNIAVHSWWWIENDALQQGSTGKSGFFSFHINKQVVSAGVHESVIEMGSCVIGRGRSVVSSPLKYGTWIGIGPAAPIIVFKSTPSSVGH